MRRRGQLYRSNPLHPPRGTQRIGGTLSTLPLNSPCSEPHIPHSARSIPPAQYVLAWQDEVKGGMLASSMVNGIEVVVAEAVALISVDTPTAAASTAPDAGPRSDMGS